MTGTPQLLLTHHLKALRLPTFLREYDKVAKQCASEGIDHSRYLLRLAELELIDRERRMVERRIKSAKFPATKSLDSFDFKAMPSLNKMLVMELARCDYISRNENIIAVGNSGTGKTHAALGLGLAACQKGLAVGFITASALVHELLEARDEKRLLRLQKQLAKYSLLIIPSRAIAAQCPAGQRTNWDMCRCHQPALNCCLRSSRNVTNADQPLSRPTCRSMNGPAHSVQNASQARFSIG